MLRMTNISATTRAAELLDRHRAMFSPRDVGEVFGLSFISSFLERDGSEVAGFKPGYGVDSVSPINLGPMWALAQPTGAPEFLFMPRFEWQASEHYVVDVASEAFELFSITPVRDS